MAPWEAPGMKKSFMPHRKVFHLLIGAVFIISMFSFRELRWFFLAVLAIGTIISFIQERRKLPVITWFLDRYEKRTDRVPGEGPLTFFFGAVLVWFLFPRDIATAAVMALTFGDPLACVTGSLLGGPTLPWNRNKTWMGTATFILVSFAVVSPVFGPWTGLVVGVSAGAAESVRWPVRILMDDNVMVPVISSFTFWSIDALFSLL